MAGGVPGGPPGDRRLGGVDAAHSLAAAATGGDAGEGCVDLGGLALAFAWILDSGTGWMEGLRSYIGPPMARVGGVGCHLPGRILRNDLLWL